MEDETLRRRIADDDPGAFAAIVSRYQPRLAGFAARMLGDLDAAQDITQETFIRLWRSRLCCPAESSLCGYLFKIARNLCLDHLRSRRVDADLDEVSETAQIDQQSAEDAIRSADLAFAVRRTVLALPEPQREVFILSHYQQMSYGEIADVIGCPLGTVASRKHQAVETLRRRLRPWVEEDTR